MTPPSLGNPLRHALGTLRVPYFLPLWLSNVAHNLCVQILVLTMQWLVTTLTPSRTLLGLVGFAQGATMAGLSPVAGVFVDRFSKRNVLVWTRVGTTALVLVVTALVAAGWIEVWHLVVASLVGGALAALMGPASQTYVFDIVGRERVANAVALNATGAGFSQMAGPAIAGLLIASVGIVGSYLSSAVGLALAAAALAAIPVLGRSRRGERRSAWRELREGFAYVRAHRPVALVMLACTTAVFNGALFPMRPIFARHVLEVGSVGYGAMATASGVGTVLAALLVTALPPARRFGLRIVGATLAFAVCLVLYALAFSYPYILAVEFLVGAVGELWHVWAVSGLQLAVPEHMRGRIIGMLFTLAQLGFIGQLAVGMLADLVGDQLALGLFGLIPTVLLTALLALGFRTIRQM